MADLKEGGLQVMSTVPATIEPEAGKIAEQSVWGTSSSAQCCFHDDNKNSSAIIFLSVRQLDMVAEHFFKNKKQLESSIRDP